MLVALEGIDGSGKSTALRRMAKRLRKAGVRTVATQEPTDSWLGQVVRQGIRSKLDPLALAGLFLADRAVHVKALRKDLDCGVVLFDRFVDSTTAYQSAALDGRIPRALDGLRILQTLLFPRPDLVLLFDLPPRDALRRIRGRRVKDPFEKRRFLVEVRANYLALARRDPRRWRVLDAHKPPGALADEAVAAILARR